MFSASGRPGRVQPGAVDAVAGTATSVPGPLRRRKDEAGAGLSPEDLTLLLGFLDALVTKNRLKALAGGVS